MSVRDVIIIGGGLAGICAALELIEGHELPGVAVLS